MPKWFIQFIIIDAILAIFIWAIAINTIREYPILIIPIFIIFSLVGFIICRTITSNFVALAGSSKSTPFNY